MRIPDFPAKLTKLSAKLTKLSANLKVHYSARHIPAEAYIIPRHDQAGPCASSSVTDTDVQQYSTYSSGAFSVGGHAHAHILGPARKEIATLERRAIKISFDFSRSRQYVMLAGM